jgi:hypothetical protein
MDILKLRVLETADINLDLTNGEPMVDEKGNRCSITVYGPGSKEYQKAQANKNRQLMEAMRKKGNRNIDQRALDAEMLAAVTVSFNNFTYGELKGRAMIEAAYRDPAIGWMAEQVGAALGDWETFLPRSEPS